MNIIRLLAVTLLLTISLSASAQQHEKQEIVLNDGIRITGIIVADSSDYLMVRIKWPRVITLSKSQIYSTSYESPEGITTIGKEGYYIQLSESILAGRNGNKSVGTMSFHLSNGYQFSNGLSAGIGTGVEKLDILVMPVYADLRFRASETRVSPFVWVKGGYGIPLSDRSGENYYYDYYPDPKGGMMFGTGFGIALYTWRSNAVSVGVGYRYQTIGFRQRNIWNGESQTELITYYNRIEVQFGFIFR